MTAVIYSLLITFGLITSPADFDNASAQEQQEMMIVVEDVIM